MNKKYKYRLFWTIYRICIVLLLPILVIVYLLHYFNEFVVYLGEVLKDKIIELKEEEL